MADLAGSEGDRGYEAIQNCYPDAITPAAARNAADFERLASRGDRLRVACCGGGGEQRARAEGEVSNGDAAMPFAVQLRVCDANLKAETAVRNAACFQQRRIPRSLFYRISMERGGRARRAK